jgi:hypothetical protein
MRKKAATARAPWVLHFHEWDTIEQLRQSVRGATDTYFDETMEAPSVIGLHVVRDEVLAR